MDFDKVTALLKETWWVNGIKKVEVLKSADNSALLVGAFTEDNNQIAYARVISDKTRFAYIMDVVVDEKHQRQGIGQAMMKHILIHRELKDVYKWFLESKDARGVYQKVGFMPVQHPEYWMEIKYKRAEKRLNSM